MRQLIAFNSSKGGTQAGYCLRNVRLGFGIPALHISAWQAWNNSPQRTSPIPTGVDVPLYYDYTDKNGNRYGHINVRLADGRVWNDGITYRDLAHYQRNSSTKYVGWSTEVNKVKVIEETAMKIGSENNWRWRFNRLHRQIVGNWDMGDATWRAIQGQDAWKVVEEWSDHPNSNITLNDQVLGEKARKENWQKRINDLTATNTDLAGSIKEQNFAIKELQLEIKELEAELAIVGDDTKNLNQLGYFLRWAITRLGLKG